MRRRVAGAARVPAICVPLIGRRARASVWRQPGVMGRGRGNAEKGRVPLPRGPADWLRGAEALPPGRPEGGASGPGTGVAYRLQPDDHGSSDRSEGAGQGGVGVPSEVDHGGGSPGAGTYTQRQVASGGFPGGRPAGAGRSCGQGADRRLGAGLRRGPEMAGPRAPRVFGVSQRRGGRGSSRVAARPPAPVLPVSWHAAGCGGRRRAAPGAVGVRVLAVNRPADARCLLRRRVL